MREFEFWLLGGAFGLSLALVVVCMLLFRVRKQWRPSVGRSLGHVEAAPLGWMNMVGVGLVFGFYMVSWSFEWDLWVEDAVSLPELLRQLLLQIGFAVVMAGMLCHRVSYRRFWGLNTKRWKTVLVASFAGFIAFVLVLELLWALGYDAWAAETFQRNAVWVVGKPAEGLLMVLLLGLVTALVAPVSEEVVFRGYVYPVLKRLGGVWLAAIASSILFATAHLDGANLLPGFLMGLILVTAYEITGSLWAPIGIHLLNNLYVFLNSI